MIRFARDLTLGRPIQVHRGSARSWLHISDAVRAIQAATRVKEYTTVNVGHPEVVPIEQLAARICAEVRAPESLVEIAELPPRMTLVKRPSLDRQRELLGVEPIVSLEEGVRLVCSRVRERLSVGGVVDDRHNR